MDKRIIASVGLANELARGFRQEFPDLSHKLNGRIEKAADILASGMVSETDTRNIWIVRSQSSPDEYYTVTNGAVHCNCQDSAIVTYCKHTIAVYFVMQAQEFDRELIQWEREHEERYRQDYAAQCAAAGLPSLVIAQDDEP